MSEYTDRDRILLRIGMQHGLLDTEALALEGDTMTELVAHAERIKAEKKQDPIHQALIRKLSRKPIPDLSPTPSNTQPLRSGSRSALPLNGDALEATLRRKLGISR